MSAAVKLTKKQKKALAFRERKGKGKAKATEDELDNDVPVMEDQDAAEAEVESPRVENQEASQAKDAGRPQVVEGKKRKRDAEEPNENVEKPKKRKKDPEQAKSTVVEGEEGGAAENEATDGKKKKKDKPQRFILFVGNLKYTTTKEAIQAHFAQCDPPPTVRLMTPKPSATGRPVNKSKGFAFLEFSEKSGLQQALKLHQSQLEGRMINVELTAGGGGKSEARLAKVRERNKELHEQRKKKLEKGKRKKQGDAEATVLDLERPQRYSATSGVAQAPSKKRTWSVPEEGDAEGKKKKRGSKKPPKALGTGVNAIPVG